MDPSRNDSRYNLNYSMGSIGLSLAEQADLYGGNPGLTGRPPSGGLIQTMGGRTSGGGLMVHSGGNGNNTNNSSQCQNIGGSGQSRGLKRTNSDCYDEHRTNTGGMSTQTLQGLESCGNTGQNVNDIDDSYNSLQNKKSPPANGKKTKGRVKIKMEYIDNKLRRYTTFSKRKTGIMKKAYELSTLTGTQVMLLVASETGHVYTFATRKLQPMITSEAGKQLIQTCLNSPDPPSATGGDQRMSATGFEETELSYNIADEDSKDDRTTVSSGNESDESSNIESPDATSLNNSQPLSIDASNLGHFTHNSQIQEPNTSTSQYEVINSQTLAHLNSGMNNALYPASALANIPQEVFRLVQSGQLQLHSEEEGDGGHELVTIPISMPGNNNQNVTTISDSNIIGLTANQFNTINKFHIKDLSMKSNNSNTMGMATKSTTNDTESSSKTSTGIKREIIEIDDDFSC